MKTRFDLMVKDYKNLNPIEGLSGEFKLQYLIENEEWVIFFKCDLGKVSMRSSQPFDVDCDFVCSKDVNGVTLCECDIVEVELILNSEIVPLIFKEAITYMTQVLLTETSLILDWVI